MQKGFTLIELLGIITILGLILIVAIPMLIESNRVAKTNENEANTDNLEMAARDYVSSCYSLGCCIEDLNQKLKNEESVKVGVSDLKACGFLPENSSASGSVIVKLKNE